MTYLVDVLVCTDEKSYLSDIILDLIPDFSLYEKMTSVIL